jgi:hypothetical protein
LSLNLILFGFLCKEQFDEVFIINAHIFQIGCDVLDDLVDKKFWVQQKFSLRSIGQLVWAPLWTIFRSQSTPHEAVRVVWHQVDLIQVEPAQWCVLEDVGEAATFVKDGINNPHSNWYANT